MASFKYENYCKTTLAKITPYKLEHIRPFNYIDILLTKSEDLLICD